MTHLDDTINTIRATLHTRANEHAAPDSLLELTRQLIALLDGNTWQCHQLPIDPCTPTRPHPAPCGWHPTNPERNS